uniref:ADAM metallopeptidase domain 9a n=1 Tax=Maylandia zebra TaxID=106582 RepID=A0A3P9AVP0_9CICH
MQLNIRVVLVGLEIWTQQNQISTDGAAGEVLNRFTQWREKELVPRLQQQPRGLVRLHRGSRARPQPRHEPRRRPTVHVSHRRLHHELWSHVRRTRRATPHAHTCPHTLTLTPNASPLCRGSKNFSSCSADDFEKMILLTGGACLLNVPRPDEAYSAPYCGNRLVDFGEECDCGSEKECEEDPCCEYRTCKLKSGAQCAYGECCSNCQFLPGGTVCRASTDECDLPEFCNGSSSLCQSDVFIQNGQSCRNQEAYCYNGKCQHYDSQCQAIFGDKAKAAPELCFKEVNSKGDRFGNCGYLNNGFKKCESRNAMCGKLQCSNVQAKTVFGIEPSIISTPIAGGKCYGVDFMLGSDVPDPGMVNEGTKCGENKVRRREEGRG